MVTMYHRGKNRENRIKQKLKKEGWFVVRSAGSKSMVDLIAIHPKRRMIKLIQSKVGILTKKQKSTILDELNALQGHYFVYGEVIDDEDTTR